jgi:hypothetical protein
MNKFADHPDFITSYTPLQMFTMGIFGNAYFQIRPKDLPDQFILDLSQSGYKNINVPNIGKNCYKVDSGSPLSWWLEKGLIHSDDPNGWVEWYIKFYYGRRHPDDLRQIGRFKAFIARHMGIIKNHPHSIKTKQNLLHWAWDYNQEIYF